MGLKSYFTGKKKSKSKDSGSERSEDEGSSQAVANAGSSATTRDNGADLELKKVRAREAALQKNLLELQKECTAKDAERDILEEKMNLQDFKINLLIDMLTMKELDEAEDAEFGG